MCNHDLELNLFIVKIEYKQLQIDYKGTVSSLIGSFLPSILLLPCMSASGAALVSIGSGTVTEVTKCLMFSTRSEDGNSISDKFFGHPLGGFRN